MLKSKILGGLAIAALSAGIAATTAANGAELSSPAEEAATAQLNQKIADGNAAEEARAKAAQEAYDRQLKQQQQAYEQQLKQLEVQREEQMKAYEQQVRQQQEAYEQLVKQQQDAYQEQLKNAQLNTAPPPSPAP
jgi:hypothetical protein